VYAVARKEDKAKKIRTPQRKVNKKGVSNSTRGGKRKAVKRMWEVERFSPKAQCVIDFSRGLLKVKMRMFPSQSLRSFAMRTSSRVKKMAVWILTKA